MSEELAKAARALFAWLDLNGLVMCAGACEGCVVEWDVLSAELLAPLRTALKAYDEQATNESSEGVAGVSPTGTEQEAIAQGKDENARGGRAGAPAKRAAAEGAAPVDGPSRTAPAPSPSDESSEGRCAKCNGSGMLRGTLITKVCDECQGFGTFKHKAPPSDDAAVERAREAVIRAAKLWAREYAEPRDIDRLEAAVDVLRAAEAEEVGDD